MPVNSDHRNECISAAPKFSPGIVENDEFLLRELFNPEHIRNEELIPRAKSLQDLRSRGFSTHRIKFVTPDFIKSSIEERLSKPRKGEPWRVEGVVRLEVKAVRQFRIDDEQLFVVIDTALENNPGHASIYATSPEKGDSYMRELRSLLLPLLQNRMSVDEAFELE